MSGQAQVVRGLVYHGPERSPTIERLNLAAPGPGEVLVRMVAAGVCHSDLHVVDGEWQRPAGVVMGHEGAAVVEALGPGVAERAAGVPAGEGGLRIGDLVVLAWTAPCGSCAACERDEAWSCEAPRGAGHRLGAEAARLRTDSGDVVGVYSGVGTFSTAQVVAAEAAIPIDRRTPAEVAALIGCAATTGIGAVRNTAAVRAGESVAVIGLGGVGLSAVLAALDIGADPVIAVDIEPAKRDLATSLGASTAIGPEELEQLAATMPSGGPDHVLECIGLASTAELAVRAVRPGGSATLVGMAPMGARAGIDIYRFVEDGKRLLGSNYGSCIPARDFPAIAADVVAGRLPLHRLVTERIGLDDIDDAFESMRRRDGVRRIVLFEER